MIPRARLRAPLWRRALAWLRVRVISSRCAYCDRYVGKVSDGAIALLHAAHLKVDQIRRLAEIELALQPRPPAIPDFGEDGP